jgi:hypothetical protein
MDRECLAGAHPIGLLSVLQAGLPVQHHRNGLRVGFLRRSVDKELLSVGGHIPDKNIAGKSTEGRVEEPSRMPVLSDVPVVASTAITVRSFTT